MPTYKQGRRFLLQVGDGASPEVFTTIAGLRNTNFTINNEAVDITNKDSSGWRTLLAGAGTRSLSVSADGVMDDVAVTQTILTDSYSSGAFKNYKIVYNSNGTTWDDIEADFQITSYERGGEDAAEETFSITLESSGTPIFSVDQTS